MTERHLHGIQPATGKGRAFLAIIALLPLLAACNTTGGDGSGLQLTAPTSRILGDAFDRDNGYRSAGTRHDADADSRLAETAQGLPGAIQQAATKAAASGNHAEAAAYWALLYYRDQTNRPVAVAYAEALRKSGSLEQALAVLKPFAEPDSAAPDALVAYAKAALEADKLAAALQAARWAVDAAPQQGEAYNVLGICLDAIGNHDEAQAAYQAALANGIPESYRTLNNLALSYAQSGDLDQARQKLETAQQLAADDPTIGSNLQLISTMDAQQDRQPVLSSLLPTRQSPQPPVPATNPHREHARPAEADRRTITASSQDSFDRLLLPRIAPDQIQIIENKDSLTISLPAGITPDIPGLRRELGRSITDIRLNADADHMSLRLALKPGIAITRQLIDKRLAIDLLIDDSTTTHPDGQQALAPRQ